MKIEEKMKITSITKKFVPDDVEGEYDIERTVVLKGFELSLTVKGELADDFQSEDVGREAYLNLDIKDHKQKKVTEF